MTTWTITIRDLDLGSNPSSVVAEHKCNGSLLKAVLTSRKHLIDFLTDGGATPSAHMLDYAAEISSEDHWFSYHPVIRRTKSHRNTVRGISVRFKYCPRSTAYKMCIPHYKGTYNEIITRNSTDVISLNCKNARRLRQRLRDNYVETSDGLQYSGIYEGMELGNLVTMLSGPYSVSNFGHITFDDPPLFEIQNGLTEVHECVSNLVMAVLDHPELMSLQTVPNFSRTISPTVGVFKWLAENNIKWFQNGYGFELTNDEDYTLYKVMFE